LTAAPGRRGVRGVSLVELAVVVFIGVVLVVSLLPTATGLLRRQAGLSAKALSVETLPLFFDRLAADFARSSAVTVVPPGPAPAFQVVLTPLAESDPEVTYTIQGASVVRTRRLRGADGRVATESHAWILPGTLDLLRDELPWGRTVFELTRTGGGAEILAFASGRLTTRREP
jgi:hypothetical protein